MTRSAGSTRRSGDPRKRAAPAQAAPTDTATRRRVVVALVAAVTLPVLALVLLRPAEPEQEQVNAAPDHADVACDLTSKAGEAAGVETDARFAAAVLLLDQAIIASARAADSDSAFTDLDQAVQAVHTAGHRGDPRQWQDALDAALEACDASTD